MYRYLYFIFVYVRSFYYVLDSKTLCISKNIFLIDISNIQYFLLNINTFLSRDACIV